jgi:carbon-monoxide dehydrogenase medium subunit
MSDLPEFSYCRPRHLDEALAALARPAARIYAGGTDLLVALTSRRPWPGATRELVDIKDLEAVHGIVDSGESLRIGAAVTAAEVAASRLVRRHAPALAQAAAETSSPSLRRRGTVGGNIVTPHPAGDMTTALLALSATVDLAGVDANASVPLADLVTTRVSAWPRKRLVVAVRVRKNPRSAFEKLGSRAAFSRSLVAVSASISGDERVSVALGGMHARPFCAVRVAAAIESGHGLHAALRREARPPVDGLASCEHRLRLAEALIERALARLRKR